VTIPIKTPREWREKPELSCPAEKNRCHCYLPAGHEGYHFARGPHGQPYPFMAPTDKLPSTDLAGGPDLHVGQYVGGWVSGYCTAWIVRDGHTIECQLRFGHPGPHGSPGLRWRPPGPAYELV
jgi:hypothetical protein